MFSCRTDHKKLIHLALSSCTIALFLALGLACTNGGSTRKSSGSEKATDPTLPKSPGTGDIYGIQITSILKSNIDATDVGANPAILDVLGDGTSTIGQYCLDPKATASRPPCSCVFEYIRSNGNPERIENPPVYTENDLMRCSFYGPTGNLLIPTDIKAITVSIISNTRPINSNKLSIKLESQGPGGITSDYLRFVRVKRFQCRDIPSVPHLLCDSRDQGDCMYDPFQSEHYLLNRPLNYYATNVGGARLQFTRLSQGKDDVNKAYTHWECDSPLTDTPTGELSPVTKQVPWTNPWIFTASSNPAPSPTPNGLPQEIAVDRFTTIFPRPPCPTGNGCEPDKVTFYLSPQKMGVFNVPINTYVGPGIMTVSPDSRGKLPKGALPPIGYAARLINETTCPAITIPSEFQWVKLWAFKGSFPSRRFAYYAQKFESGLNRDIYCPNGNLFAAPTCPLIWTNSGLNYNIEGTYYGNEAGKSFTNPYGMMFRVFGTKVPFTIRKVNPAPNPIDLFNPSYTGVCTSVRSLASGNPAPSTLFRAEPPSIIGPSTASPVYSSVYSPSNWQPSDFPIIKSSGGNTLNFSQFFPFTQTSTPSAPNVTIQSGSMPLEELPADGGNPQPDYLFVVTPLNVSMSVDDLAKYQPYVFLNEDACIKKGECKGASFENWVRYVRWDHPIGSSSTEIIYPVCVLQPKQGVNVE